MAIKISFVFLGQNKIIWRGSGSARTETCFIVFLFFLHIPLKAIFYDILHMVISFELIYISHTFTFPYGGVIQGGMERIWKHGFICNRNKFKTYKISATQMIQYKIHDNIWNPKYIQYIQNIIPLIQQISQIYIFSL